MENVLVNVNLDEKEVENIVKNTIILFKHVNITNIVEIVSHLMKIAGNYKNLSGLEKKDLVTNILIYIVNTTQIFENNAEKISDAILLTLIPIIIDNFIAIENGKLRFNPKIRTGCINLISCKNDK